jgi:hypothetical protein
MLRVNQRLRIDFFEILKVVLTRGYIPLSFCENQCMSNISQWLQYLKAAINYIVETYREWILNEL